MVKDGHPLFNQVFNAQHGMPNFINLALEAQIKKDGFDYASKRITEVFIEQFQPSQSLVKQFILEELDAMRYGDETAKTFAKNSGFSESEYYGAMDKSEWEGKPSKLEQMQLFIRVYSSSFSDKSISSQLMVKIVDNIMREYKLGKYGKQ